MKNLIEGMTTMIMISLVSIVLLSLILVEFTFIKNRNIFYQKYEEALVNGQENIEITQSFEVDIPFIGDGLSFSIKGWTR